jgi:hypothetical protein
LNAKQTQPWVCRDGRSANASRAIVVGRGGRVPTRSNPCLVSHLINSAIYINHAKAGSQERE